MEFPMSLLSNLATLVDGEFKAVLPALNSVVSDMGSNYAAWQANPVVKATEAAVTLVNPVAAVDMQAVIGAASLVQALWEVFGATQAPAAAAPAPVVTPTPAAPVTLQAAVAATGATIPPQVNAAGDPQPSHM
jgi:hypothetical protein